MLTRRALIRGLLGAIPAAVVFTPKKTNANPFQDNENCERISFDGVDYDILITPDPLVPGEWVTFERPVFTVARVNDLRAPV
jgi:hypothetical protein